MRYFAPVHKCNSNGKLGTSRLFSTTSAKGSVSPALVTCECAMRTSSFTASRGVAAAEDCDMRSEQETRSEYAANPPNRDAIGGQLYFKFVSLEYRGQIPPGWCFQLELDGFAG